MSKYRAGGRHALVEADDKKLIVPIHSSSIEGTHYVGHAGLAFPSFVGRARIQFVKAVAALLAISILLLLYFHDSFLTHKLFVRPLAHRVQNVASSFLEVFQVYPPVLTISPDGLLEIDDGSAKGTVQILDSSRRKCEQVLADHSFAFSYGDPFVGEYTPPSCPSSTA